MAQTALLQLMRVFVGWPTTSGQSNRSEPPFTRPNKLENFHLFLRTKIHIEIYLTCIKLFKPFGAAVCNTCRTHWTPPLTLTVFFNSLAAQGIWALLLAQISKRPNCIGSTDRDMPWLPSYPDDAPKIGCVSANCRMVLQKSTTYSSVQMATSVCLLTGSWSRIWSSALEL